MTSIFQIPSEVHAQQMVPYLPAQDTRNLSLVSKVAHQIVEEAVTYPQEDITLEGERVTINLFELADGTIAALLRQKVKMEIVTRWPELLTQISKGYAALSTANSSPDARTLFEYKDADGCFCPGITDESKWLLIAFDFNAKQIQAGGVEDSLESVLIRATSRNELYNLDLLRSVSSHPKYANIPSGGAYGLGQALQIDVSTNNWRLLQIIRSHPNYKNIPAEGDYGLGDALTLAVANGYSELVRMILSHPNAVNIPTRGELGLGYALAMAITTNQCANQPELVRMILSHPYAFTIPADGLEGEYTLKHALKLATLSDLPEIVDMVSAFLEKSADVEFSKARRQAEDTAMDVTTNDDPYGVREELDRILNSDNPEVAQALAELLAQLKLNAAEPVHTEVHNSEPMDVDSSGSDREEDAPALRHALNKVQNARHNND